MLFRSAFASCLKVLKLLLVSQAYAFILSVSHEINLNAKAVNGERHLAACLVQDAVKLLLSNSEQKLKHVATVVAKSLAAKVYRW